MLAAPRRIAQIDKDIDAVRAELRRRRPVNHRMSAAIDCHLAWDAEPELKEQELALFRERGFAQQARDVAAFEAAKKASWPTTRIKRCPTCGR